MTEWWLRLSVGKAWSFLCLRKHRWATITGPRTQAKWFLCLRCDKYREVSQALHDQVSA